MIIGSDSIRCVDSNGSNVTVTEEQLAAVPDLAAGSGTGTTAITAFAGGGQSEATALVSTFNNITVVATDGDSVKLPSPTLGKRITVKNSDTTQVVAVWPADGHTINGMAADTAVGIPPACERTFWGTTTTAWVTGEALLSIAPTAQKGALVVKAADSAGDTVTTITNASQAQASTITFPDLGAAWSVVGSEGDQTIDGIKTFEDAIRTTANVGAAAAGSTAVEYGDGTHHRTVLTVNTTLPAIAGGADLAVGKLLYTLPAGAVIIESAHMNLAITQSEGNITADTPDGGLGTVIGSGAVADLSGTGTFEDIITGQTFNDCDGTAEVKTAIPTGAVPLVIESGAAHTIYFNVADGWAASGDAAAALAGTVVINWRFVA